jgi:hypothetical protein
VERGNHTQPRKSSWSLQPTPSSELSLSVECERSALDVNVPASLLPRLCSSGDSESERSAFSSMDAHCTGCTDCWVLFSRLLCHSIASNVEERLSMRGWQLSWLLSSTRHKCEACDLIVREAKEQQPQATATCGRPQACHACLGSNRDGGEKRIVLELKLCPGEREKRHRLREQLEWMDDFVKFVSLFLSVHVTCWSVFIGTDNNDSNSPRQRTNGGA